MRPGFRKAAAFYPARAIFKTFHILGLLSCVCVIGFILCPWDENPKLHVVFATCLFFCGSLFGAPALAVGWLHRHHYWPSLALALCTIVSSVGIVFFSTRGTTTLSVPLSFTHQSFDQYCQGSKGSLHSDWNMNSFAFCEWCWLASLMLHAFLRFHWDLSGWPLSPERPGTTDSLREEWIEGA